MAFASSSRSEADLVAHFEYNSALEGSERPAYVPVVASGANALVIHYTENNCKLNDGEVSRRDSFPLRSTRPELFHSSAFPRKDGSDRRRYDRMFPSLSCGFV